MANQKQIEIAKKKILKAFSISNHSNIINMAQLNKNETVKLKGMLSEAVASLQVIQDEKQHIGDIAERVANEIYGGDKQSKKVFRKTASLVFKGKLDEENKTIEECQDMYDQISSIV